ncbi:MAG: Flp pilus assembly protein CpaB [Anaerolineaceae bacterium]|nr:Flp pilus assembly protein CpaB [Anaerolineaceae bacterium]
MAAGGRRSGLLFIILALVLIVILAVAAFFMRNQFFPAQRAQDLATPIPSQTLVKIVVLAQPVTRGAVLSEGELQTISYPQSEMVDGLFFTDMAQVVGKRAKFDLQQGMPLTPSMITNSQTGSEISFQIPKGMVAMSIPITRLTSVSYGLQPGDHVNILGAVTMVDMDTNFQSKLPNNSSSVIAPGPSGGSSSGSGSTGPTTLSLTLGGSTGPQGRAEIDPTFNQPVYVIPSEPQRPRLVSQTMIQDAVVLYVGTFPLDANGQPASAPSPTPAPSSSGAQVTPEAVQPPDVISLIVSPQDAVTLNYLLLAGDGAKINLVLRSPGDDLKAQTEPVTLQFVMDQYNIPLPSKLPYGIEPAINANNSTLSYPLSSTPTPK